MKKSIELNKQPVEYTLKVSSRARCLRLAIYGDGNFVVTTPRWVSNKFIEQFIIQKSQWIINKLAYFKSISQSAIIKDSAQDYQKYKESARSLAQERLEYFNRAYGFKFKRISIRNQKTRWGSCSRRGNLSFNYKIVRLPVRLADYIIIHELCHLQEFNHSPRFWNLVARTMPDYLSARRELRQGGMSLY